MRMMTRPRLTPWGWPETTYTAIDPNGVTHTRTTTVWRTYTHTVVARLNKADYEAAYADARHAAIDGRAWESAKDTARIAGRSREQYVADELAGRLARLEAMDFHSFVNLGWCGRRDLADKLKAEATGRWHTDVTILEALTTSR